MNGQKAMLSAGLFMFRLAVFFLVIAGICRVGETAYNFSYSIVLDAPVDAQPGRDVSVTLEEGMDAARVAELLERKGLIKDAGIFRIQLSVAGYNNSLREGSYVLNTSMTPREMMAVMAGEEKDAS